MNQAQTERPVIASPSRRSVTFPIVAGWSFGVTSRNADCGARDSSGSAAPQILGWPGCRRSNRREAPDVPLILDRDAESSRSILVRFRSETSRWSRPSDASCRRTRRLGSGGSARGSGLTVTAVTAASICSVAVHTALRPLGRRGSRPCRSATVQPVLRSLTRDRHPRRGWRSLARILRLRWGSRGRAARRRTRRRRIG